MKKLIARKALLTALALSMAVIVSAGSALGAEKVLRFQVNYPGTSYGGASMKYFAKQVAEESQGKLEVQLFFAGQILKTNEAFSAMQKGMVDGLYSALLYYAGVVKEASWEWLPFTWRTPEQVNELYLEEGLLDVMQEALARHEVRYLAPIPMGSLGFLTKFPVKGLADFKGKKIRGAGPQAGTIQILGGSPVALSAAEQYTALQRGAIEGTIYPFYTIGVYKFYEVIDYIVVPGVYSPCVIDLVMNQASWDSLSAEMQDAITRAALNTMKWTGQQNKKWDEEGLAVAAEKKVQKQVLTEAEFNKLREAARPLWEKAAARSELSAKAVGIIENYMKDK